MAEQTCPRCGEVLAAETRFCTRCGVDLYAARAGAPGTGPGGSPFEGPSNQQFARPPGVAPPKNYLIESILATVCCCLPLGVAAIVFAAKVDGLAHQGDYAGAVEAANKAKMFAILAVVGGLIANVIYLVFMLPGMMQEIQDEIQKQTPAPQSTPQFTMPEMLVAPQWGSAR